MAACADFDARLFDKLWSTPVQRQTAFGQCTQGVQCGQCMCQRLQGIDMGLQALDELFVEPFFTGQGAILRREGLVFKRLEFGRNETLGILERLTALVV